MFQILLVVIYLSFISLGLPDSLLGSAWPTIYPQFNVPLSYAGVITMIISVGTITSSLMSDRLTKALGTGKVTAISVAITAASLFGFSVSNSFIMLCIMAIPYGLGAGSVDASLNNYVALYYESRHMSWLHCMWGIGATVGPYIMGLVLTNGGTWHGGYRTIGIIQLALTVVLFISLPMWQKRTANTDIGDEPVKEKPLSFIEIVNIPGTRAIMLCFFCYCAIEMTTGLWAGSYLHLQRGISAETAAGFAGMFYLGITAGRAINGFIAMKLNDRQMIRIGETIMAAGIIILFIPSGEMLSLIGFIIVGLGCAPVYPCIIHSTPDNFGADKSQAIIGVEMASAYAGNLLMPVIFGLIANYVNIALLPFYVAVLLIVMICMFEKLVRKI